MCIFTLSATYVFRFRPVVLCSHPKEPKTSRDQTRTLFKTACLEMVLKKGFRKYRSYIPVLCMLRWQKFTENHYCCWLRKCCRTKIFFGFCKRIMILNTEVGSSPLGKQNMVLKCWIGPHSPLMPIQLKMFGRRRSWN